MLFRWRVGGVKAIMHRFRGEYISLLKDISGRCSQRKKKKRVAFKSSILQSKITPVHVNSCVWPPSRNVKYLPAQESFVCCGEYCVGSLCTHANLVVVYVT